MVAPRSLIAPALVGFGIACTATIPEDRPSAMPSDASAPDAAPESAMARMLPYPPGPYGAGIGDVLGDFRVQGYALSRTERDRSKLPFRDVTLSEVRSDPACACLVVMWSSAGQNCFPSITGRNALADAVARDPSLCVLDVLFESLDTGPPRFDGVGWQMQPPTRADLEAVVDSAPLPFPVTLVTDDAFARLDGNAISASPIFFVVRASDMRIVSFLWGTDTDLETSVRSACASPRDPAQVLARGLRPRGLALDEAHAYTTDDEGGVRRIPRGGGAAAAVTTTASPTDRIAIDTTNVYFTTTAAPYTLARAPKAGGPAITIATAPSRYTSLASDGARVYFTRDDGVVASVAVAGGNETTLATGDADPVDVAVDAERVYWLVRGSGEVVAVPKAGGPRAVLVAADGRKRAQLMNGRDGLVVREKDNPTNNSFSWVPKSGAAWRNFDPDYGNQVLASFDDVTGLVDIVMGAQDPRRGHQAGLLHFPVMPNENGVFPATGNTLGLRDVTAVASGGDGYVYWTTNEPEGGALRRIRR